MNCKLPSVTISGLALSDLFFNHENENYATACRNSHVRKASKEEYDKAIHEALLTDAQEFTQMADYGNKELPALLVEDFLARI